VCGARGCLAAWASGRALARVLRELGEDVPDSRSVVELARTGHAEATRLVREAGLMIGDVLATAVSLLNPRILALGGDLVVLQDHFVGAVRERLYQRTQPQAARGLQVVASKLGDRAGVVGAARLALEEVLSAEAVDRALAGRRQPAGQPAP
jgi:predicted NBD/HSP70 family sugar kinase